MNTTPATDTTPSLFPVAAEPDANAATYSEVLFDAEHATKPFVDDETPEGHFAVTVKNLGGIQTYFLKGAFGDGDARIVGRIQVVGNSPAMYYSGGSLFGGSLFLRR